MTLSDRLREGLRRTREKLGLPFGPGEAPDWEAVEESLMLADVGIAASREIIASLSSRRGDFRENLRAVLLEILARPASPEASTVPLPKVTMVVGVNGVGKTTCVAKLARRLTSEGKRVLLVTADTFRAAAQEQLATWAERASVDIVGGDPGRDPASVVHDGLTRARAEGFDEVLVDTAGRLHTKRPLMDEIAKVGRIAEKVIPNAPHETLLVLDATVGTNGLHQARQFTDAIKVTGIVLAKMDGTARGGVVVAIAKDLELPVRYVGVGEDLDDLLPFNPEDFVAALTTDN
ncbi:MAG: signal recognition particle-docking protein FtsY [Vicinamibacteria bacterium]